MLETLFIGAPWQFMRWWFQRSSALANPCCSLSFFDIVVLHLGCLLATNSEFFPVRFQSRF